MILFLIKKIYDDGNAKTSELYAEIDNALPKNAKGEFPKVVPTGRIRTAISGYLEENFMVKTIKTKAKNGKIVTRKEYKGVSKEAKELFYDKEFMTHLFESMQKRSEKGIEGFHDDSLLCNKLDIHSVRIMRNCHENRARVFRYSNGGTGYYWVFVTVFRFCAKLGFFQEHFYTTTTKSLYAKTPF